MYVFTCKIPMWNWHSSCTLRLKGGYHIVCVNKSWHMLRRREKRTHTHCIPMCIEYTFLSWLLCFAMRSFLFAYECIKVKFRELKEPWYFTHTRYWMHYSVDKQRNSMQSKRMNIKKNEVNSEHRTISGKSETKIRLHRKLTANDWIGLVMRQYEINWIRTLFRWWSQFNEWFYVNLNQLHALYLNNGLIWIFFATKKNSVSCRNSAMQNILFVNWQKMHFSNIILVFCRNSFALNINISFSNSPNSECKCKWNEEFYLYFCGVHIKDNRLKCERHSSLNATVVFNFAPHISNEARLQLHETEINGLVC